MGKYQQDVQTLLDQIGGKANIQAVSHCMTRMRFVLVDPKKADEKEIEKIPSVKGTFTQAGQYQVIIGNDVANFYQEFTKFAGIEGVSKDAVKSAAKTNQNPLQRIMGALGEIFAPIIPALICGGLVLGFRNIIGEVDLLNGRTQSLADVSQFWAGMYSFLWLIGEAIFHFLPVGITWSITKKMGTTQILGIVLGLTLISPQLLNGFSVATTPASEIPVWDFGFAQVQMVGYQGQVVAAIMAGFVLVYLEKFFKKICPEVVSMVVVPFCALVPCRADRAYGCRTDRLEDRRLYRKYRQHGSGLQLQAGLCRTLRLVLRADRHDRPASYDQRHRLTAGQHLRRHQPLADDCAVQHCAGLGCAGHVLPAKAQ